MTVFGVGDRVVTPDPQKVNPFGSPPGPYGPGEVTDVDLPKYAGGSYMLTIRLDSGEQVRMAEIFVTKEES